MAATHPGGVHAGGCLCGRVRYETAAAPIRVTVCYCRFCQRATGSIGMIEPIFPLDAFRITAGDPATHDHRSEGSGKMVRIHFCAACGTKLRLTFERFPEVCGVYVGTFDDPHWVTVHPDWTFQIYAVEARADTILMAGVPTYMEHSRAPDGTLRDGVVLPAPMPVRSRPVCLRVEPA